MALSEWLENRPDSGANIPAATVRPRRPSTLRLFENSKKLLSHVTSRQSPNTEDFKKPKTLVVEDVVREFEENYKSPTRPSSVKSKNFVKKLVAALERKQRENQPDDSFEMRYDRGPIYAYERSGTIRKSEVKDRRQNQEEANVRDEVKNVDEKTKVKEQETAPRIVGAFLKKPIEVQDTSIYWIPITGKKLPRKKSFKKLLARLRGGKGDKRSTTKTKQVVFASQEKLVEEIHDSGYEGRSASSRTSSLTSFTETLMYHDNDYVDKAYTDCNFSTFVTSSPVKKSVASSGVKNLIPDKKLASEVEEIREDSGYMSNHSIIEESIPKNKFVATRVQQISYQLAKLPKHPFARSEPRLYQQYDDERSPCGEIITLRRSIRDEPIYDVPQTRPRSSILDESLSMKRRNVPVQAVAPFTRCAFPVFSNFEDDEQPHYATVKPRNSRTYISLDNICTNFSGTPKQDLQKDPIVARKSLHSSFADLTANESFVITMYV